jgi:hypothetical protein
MLKGSNSRMEDKAFKNSTTPVSLSIYFSDSSANYKYSDIGSGAARYISSKDIFKFFVKEPFVPNSKRFRGLHPMGTLFSKSTHH